MSTISVIIITKNEQDRIKACLESIKWVDEIVVIDKGSSDATLEIAKKYTNKLVTKISEDFSVVRNKGIEVATGDWVLYVDPDERVTEELEIEIKNIIENKDFSAFAISRKNIIFGEPVSYSAFWPDWVVRLIKKSEFETWVGEVHEYPKFKGKLGYTKNSFIHLTHRDVDQIILKSLEWSKIDANLRLKNHHPKMTGWRFLRIFITEIFQQGIIRKGFFNGTVGIMDSLLQTFSMVITYIRLWQLQRSDSLEKTYEEIDRKLIENGFKS